MDNAEDKERIRRQALDLRLIETIGICLGELAVALLPELAEGIAEIVATVLEERQGNQ